MSPTSRSATAAPSSAASATPTRRPSCRWCFVLLDGSVVAEGPDGRREIAADDFFQFHMTTSRRPGEVVVEARFPVLPKGAGYGLRRVHAPPWRLRHRRRRRGRRARSATAARRASRSPPAASARGRCALPRPKPCSRARELATADLEAAGEAAKERRDRSRRHARDDRLPAPACWRRSCGAPSRRRLPAPAGHANEPRPAEAEAARSIGRSEDARRAHGQRRAGRARGQRAHAALRFPAP